MTLSEALSPMTVTEFLERSLGRHAVVIRGGSGRFRHLVKWRDLNKALGRTRVDNDRVFLVKNATAIDRSSYQRTFGRRGDIKLLDGPAIEKHVAAGATLVVNKVDEMFPGVRRLAESCEHLFHIYVGANLYAGWRRDNGFDVHWDPHDTLILQIRGRKDWKVWAPTREYPLADEPANGAAAPASEPFWQGSLEDGDVLYMPRGWWHVAYPCDELSLHITLGIAHPTGMDLLGWVLDKMKASVHARMDVPHWRGDDDRSAWTRALQESLNELMTDDVVGRYIRSLASSAQPRPIVRLRSGIRSRTSLQGDTPLRLTQGNGLQFDTAEDGSVFFTARDAEWRCHAALAPALALLNHVAPCTLDEMNRLLTPAIKPLLRPFVTALLVGEVVWAEPRVEDEDTVHGREAGEAYSVST